MFERIIKRDGKKDIFNFEKIEVALKKCYKATKEELEENVLETIKNNLIDLSKETKEIEVEKIQDIIENTLMKINVKTAKAYILFRDERNKARNKKKHKINSEIISAGESDVVRENANMAAETPAGMMSKLGFEEGKRFALENLISKEFKKMHENGDIHIHDLDWSPTGSLTCLQSDMTKPLAKGFEDSHGGMRGCKRITSAARMVAISIQKSQNLQHGGQSIHAIDFFLAPYIKLSFKEHFKKAAELLFGLEDEDKKRFEETKLDDYIKKDLKGLNGFDRLLQIAINETIKETKQAMKGFVHDVNQMASRAGCQVAFSSVNLGTDTSPEGRLLTKSLLEALEDGVGPKRKTAIYPITIFKVKKGINRLQEDKNKDLYDKAIKVAAKRFYPTFTNLDATFNQHENWDINDQNRFKYETSVMGCRTRVFENRQGEKTSLGRGNASFTSINLPRLAILANKNLNVFFESLEEKIEQVAKQLKERLDYQGQVKAKQVWYLTNNLTEFGNELKPEDKLIDFVKQFTLGVGFIGLAETLISLTGKHHAESEEIQELGIKIISFIKNKVDAIAEKTKLNYSVLAAPAEGLSNRFTNLDIAKFGEVENVTTKGYYTNSHQIPMAWTGSMASKIKIEAAYHALTLGGHIMRLEFDGDPSVNITAIKKALELAFDSDVGYIGINHNDNYCEDCGENFKSRDTKTCPKCGSHKITVISTITGYLSAKVSEWNSGKKLEFKDRKGQDYKVFEKK